MKKRRRRSEGGGRGEGGGGKGGTLKYKDVLLSTCATTFSIIRIIVAPLILAVGTSNLETMLSCSANRSAILSRSTTSSSCALATFSMWPAPASKWVVCFGVPSICTYITNLLQHGKCSTVQCNKTVQHSSVSIYYVVHT